MAISHLNNNAAPPILSEPGSAVAEGVHPVPSAASGKQKSYASQAGPPVGSDQRPPRASSTMMGHVPQRVGHDECPVGSRATERQYRDRQPSWRPRAQYLGRIGWLRRQSLGLLVSTGGQRSIRPACSTLKAASLGNESSPIAARVCRSWPTGSFR